MSEKFPSCLPTIFNRTSVDMLLGLECTFRTYTTKGDAARGVAIIDTYTGEYVMPAYILNNGGFIQGVVVSHDGTEATLILTQKDDMMIQSQLAEKIDFWEQGHSNRIYCLNEKSCGAVVFTGSPENRKFLLIRMNAGHCGLPKGHIEKYETERETAIREIHEETGVVVKLIDGFREVVNYQVSAKTKKESVYFIGYFDDGNVRIQESEISSYSLLPYSDAREAITHDNDRTVFDDAVKWLAQNDV